MYGNSLTNIYDVLKRGESSLNAQRNPLQRNDVGEYRVPHDVSPHQSASFVLQCENILKLFVTVRSIVWSFANENRSAYITAVNRTVHAEGKVGEKRKTKAVSKLLSG